MTVRPEDLWRSWRHPPPAKPPPLQGGLFDKPPASRLPLWEPLYPTETAWPGTVPRKRSRQCTSCQLHKDVRTVCAGPMDVGPKSDRRLLVVFGTPTQDEDRGGHLHSSVVSTYVQRIISKVWPGQVRYTYAVGCASGKSATEQDMRACLPHVWHDWDRFDPERVLLLGYVPIKAVTGRYIDPKVRRPWGIVRGTPIFPMRNPEDGGRNIHHKRQFEKDLRWATKAKVMQPQGEVRVLQTPQEAAAYLANIVQGRVTIVDAEWAGHPWKEDFRLLCVGLCQDPEHPVVIPAAAFEGIADRFRAWMADPRYPKGNQQINADRQALYRQFGVDLVGVQLDTYLWSRLHEPEAPGGLGAQAWLVGFGGYKEEAADSEDRSRGGANKFENQKPDDLHTYNGRDTSITLRLAYRRAPTLGKLQGTWERLVGPAFTALGKVERTGMMLSTDNVKAYDRWLQDKEERAWGELRRHPEVPEGFNPGSSQQKAELLYDKLGLRAPKDRNVQKGTLQRLRSEHSIVQALMDLSGISKQRSTYGLSMLNHISPLDGRVHTSFDLVRTGRLSSRDPNIQNITKPRNPGDEGSWARGCFVSGPGRKLVAVDYSQMELRVAAMVSGDATMTKAFADGIDFHTSTAAAAYGVDMAKITKDQRQVGKALNFGLVFGKDEFGLAKDLGITINEAKDLIETLMGNYEQLGDWRRNQIVKGEVDGEIWCVWDPPGSNLGWVHRRGVEDVVLMPNSDKFKGIRKHWRNVCLNTPIQNIANCFSLASLVEVVNWVEECCPQARVLMVVHDEILLDCPDDMVEYVATNVARIMTSWPSGGVPLKAEAEVGDDWGHMGPLPLAA